MLEMQQVRLLDDAFFIYLSAETLRFLFLQEEFSY